MYSSKKSSRVVALEGASERRSVNRPVLQQQARGGQRVEVQQRMQQLVTGSTRVQVATQRQGLTATKSRAAVQRKANKAAVAQLVGKLEGKEKKKIEDNYVLAHEDNSPDISFIIGTGPVIIGYPMFPKETENLATLLTWPINGERNLHVKVADDIYEVSPAMINAFWEHETRGESGNNQGLYGHADYKRIAEPDIFRNCAAYATGSEEAALSDPGTLKKHLKDHATATKLADLAIGTKYIINKGSHFISLWKKSETTFTTKETNGPSAFYERQWTVADLQDRWKPEGDLDEAVIYKL
jgi:hypothetical protein